LASPGSAAPDHTLWIALVSAVASLLATIAGGFLVILSNWIAERRKVRNEQEIVGQRERALLTAMFVVRNHIVERLNEWDEDGRLSRLMPLRTAQAYVQRLIDNTPGESEALMIGVLEFCLKLDAVLAVVDRRSEAPDVHTAAEWAALLTTAVDELKRRLDQFDAIAMGHLSFVSDEDLARMRWLPDVVEPPDLRGAN
jgi:hypothetical protein